MASWSWTITTECAIDAPPDRVWRILLESERYPEWNPFILELGGALRPGGRIRFRFEMPPGVRLWATATVLVVRHERELRWAGTLLVGWLFRGEHFHVIEPSSPATVRFRHGETFSGLLMPLVRLMLRRRGPPVYRAFNEALNRRAAVRS